MLSLLAYLAASFCLGWCLLCLIDPDQDGLERVALAYGTGAGVLTLTLMLAAAFGMRISAVSGAWVCAALVLAVGTAIWRTRRWSPPSFDLESLKTISGPQVALITLVGMVLGITFSIAAYWPPYAYDSLAMWVQKAKLMAMGGSLSAQLTAANNFYPLNIPLQLTLAYLLSPDLLQLIFPVYFASLGLVLYANLRRLTGRTAALACMLFLCTVPILIYHATIAYADIPFAFYYVASAIYLFKYLQDARWSTLLLSSLLIGLAGWTRPEALLYFAINVAVLLAFNPRARSIARSAALYGGGFAVFWLPWTVYLRIAGMGNYMGEALRGSQEIFAGQLDLSRLAEILRQFQSQALLSRDWGFLWLAVPIAVLIGWSRWREHAPLLALLGLNWLALVYTYYSAAGGAGTSLDWWLGTGFDRMALHWAPLNVFYLGLTLTTVDMTHSRVLTYMKRIDPYLVLLVLFSLFAIGPLLAPGYFWGAHDGRHSVYFLFEFDRVIQDGILYPRWLPDFTFGYGYPFFNIYGPGAFYVGEAFRLMGFDLVQATKIVFALATVLSGLSTFGFVRRVTGSREAAFVSGLMYVYIPYHILDLYVRAALEESVALVFLPLAFWAFYETALRPRRTSIVGAALAYAAMLFSHSVTTILATPILALWVLMLIIGDTKKRPEVTNLKLAVASLVKSGLAPLGAILLGVGLASISFIPAVLENQFVRQDQWFGSYYNYTNHFIYLFQLFSPNWGFGISVPGPNDGMSFQLGAMPLLLACLSSIAIVKNAKGLRHVWIFFLAVAVVIAFLTLNTAAPIWKTFSFFGYAQFPWRLLAQITLPLAVLAGAIVTTDEPDKTNTGLALPTVLLGVLILLGSYPYLTAQTQLEAKEGPVSLVGLMKFQQSAGEMTGSTIWVKEIPNWSDMADVWLTGKRVKTKIVLTDYPEDVLQAIPLPNMTGMHANGERLVLHVGQDNLPVRFNMFYYPGWHAYLVKPGTTEIIRELPIETVRERGQIQVRMPKGREQWLMLRFDDTPPRIIGTWISALCVLLSIGLLAWEVVAQRKGRAQQA